jgi:hypothetical protein
MRMSPLLADLASRVDDLLLKPGNMAAARALAEACLANPVQGNVDAFQFPTNPDNPLDWTEESIAIERDHEQARVLTPGQTALVLATLHDIYCPGVEQVIAVPAVDRPWDDEGRPTNGFSRYVRWRAIRDRVRGFGDYALHWFALQVRRFERSLSEQIPTPSTQSESPRTDLPACDLLGGLPQSRKRAYQLCLSALEAAPHLKDATDKDIYDWLSEHRDEGDDPLPKFETFSRYLGECRNKLGNQKRKPRAGRPTGRSIVQADEIEYRGGKADS